MADEQYWAAVRALRLDIADLLASLAPAEWDAPSLCPGWRVRDVAGHLSSVPTVTTWELLSAAPRAGFNPHRITTVLARRRGSVTGTEIVRVLRDHASDRSTAMVLDVRNALFDAIVHSQDIAVALNRDFPVAVEPTRAGLQRVWDMGWPFNARRRLGDRTLSATDTDWTAGTGPEVTGPALALLMLLTGRDRVVLDELRGPGVQGLAA